MTTEPGDNKVCPLCGGHLSEGIATLPFVIKGRVVVVKDVISEVCNECGEAFLSGKATDAVTSLLQNAVKSGAELSLVTFSE